VIGTQITPVATHIFATAGVYTVAVTVTDTAGLSSVVTTQVTVS
jgi:PKD repeat protein